MTAINIIGLKSGTPQAIVPLTTAGDTYVAPVSLIAATGNEIALDLQYTVNKATSGNDTGLLINQTDTASPGTSLLADFQVGGATKFNVDNAGVATFTEGSVASSVADGAAANAFILNSAALTTTGANLLQIQNNATPVFDFSYQGGIDHVNSGASTAAHSQSLNLNWVSGGTRTSSGQYSAVFGNNCSASSSYGFAIGSYAACLGSYNFTMGANANGYGSYNFTFGQDSACWTASGHSAMFGKQGKMLGSCGIGMGAGYFASNGDAQIMTHALKIATTDATQTTLQANATDLIIPADTTWAFSALVAARSDETDGNEQAAWEIKGLLGRDESSNTAMVGTPVVTQLAASTNAIADGWAVVVEADDTNEALALKVTGFAATNIRWVAKVDISQVTFA